MENFLFKLLGIKPKDIPIIHFEEHPAPFLTLCKYCFFGYTTRDERYVTCKKCLNVLHERRNNA